MWPGWPWASHGPSQGLSHLLCEKRQKGSQDLVKCRLFGNPPRPPAAKFLIQWVGGFALLTRSSRGWCCWSRELSLRIVVQADHSVDALCSLHPAECAAQVLLLVGRPRVFLALQEPWSNHSGLTGRKNPETICMCGKGLTPSNTKGPEWVAG